MAHNVDDLLNKVAQPSEATIEQSSQQEEAPEKAEKESSSSEESGKNEGEKEKLSYLDQFRKDKEEALSKKAEESTEKLPSDAAVDEDNAILESSTQDVDDYGVEVEKPKVYTEQEVQEIIRKRLKLHHEEKQMQQPMTPQQQQAAQDFTPDAESSESWEVQLKNHIKQTLHEIKHEEQEYQWRAEEQRIQEEFESKFTSGMQRYKDFNEVVSGKPITNGILKAARGMKDPAAFVYAASKQQPQELERISKITDPYQLAAEVGRLEERMRKAKTVSSAPKPVTKTKGDIHGKDNVKTSLDDLIRMDAKRKLTRR